MQEINTIFKLDKEILEILLEDKSTKKNIIWAVDDYKNNGKNFSAGDFILTESLINNKIIKPRAQKTKDEKNLRMRKNAEVFTPAWVCNIQNNLTDNLWFDSPDIFNKVIEKGWKTKNKKIQFTNNKTWIDYVKSKRLEITCGEAPYLTSCYDAVTGEYIEPKNRIGILDRKLRVISENINKEKEWIQWAVIALKSVYGYDIQGDNIILARTNLLLSVLEYYKYVLKKELQNSVIKEFAHIISWNIWQMDGLTCKTPSFENNNKNSKQTGILCKIMDWEKNLPINFENLINNDKIKKFTSIVGNPPYQGENHRQIYPDFYLLSQRLGDSLSLIFPTTWQEAKNRNNLSKMNNEKTKKDKQIILIDNRHNLFPDIQGAERTNIILWEKGYNNNLGGAQLIYTNGKRPKETKLLTQKEKTEKPKEIRILAKLVKKNAKYESLKLLTSRRRPYGLCTDVIKDYKKYNLEPLYSEKKHENDIKIYAKSGQLLYAPKDYKFPKNTKTLDKYKLFVPYAWGNMVEKAGLGGAYSDIIIASPNEACTETYLESGCFDDYETAKKHAKYLMTRFARALLYLNKTSQHSTTAWKAVPIQDYTEAWWDKSIKEIDFELAKKYKIPNNIAEFISKNIQTRSEKNIVNFK